MVSGRSGVELARDIIERMTGEELTFSPIYHDDRSREFWAGWALAYYQWFCGCTFRQLDEELPIESIMIMYDKYHEMDIMHFVDSVDDMRSKARITS